MNTGFMTGFRSGDSDVKVSVTAKAGSHAMKTATDSVKFMSIQ